MNGGTLQLNRTTGTWPFGNTILNGSGGGILKTGAGTVELTNAGSTYTGGTMISAGTLYLNAVNAGNGTGLITLGDANTGTDNVQLDVRNIGLPNAITVANQGTGTATLRYVNVAAGWTQNGGTITLNRATTLSVPNTTDTIIFNPALAGSGALTVGTTNSQRFLLNTNSPTYTGDITVSSGAVLEPRQQLSSATGNSVTVDTGGILQIVFVDTSIDALNGDGAVRSNAFDVGGPARVLTVGKDDGGGSFSGTISDNGHVLALTKTGAGTQTLSGTNTYTGTTTISGGTLEVNKLADGALSSSIGAASLSASNLVLNGGTLKYSGTGVTDGTTDKLFTLGTGVSAGTLDASGGSGSPMVFTNISSMAFTGSGARTLTLAGTNTDANSLAAVIGDGFGGATSVTKIGTGSWTIASATNSYSGNTLVSLGLLDVTGSLANNGSNKVFVAADANGDFATGADSKISRNRGPGASYAGYGSAITSSLLTKADLLGGTNSTGPTEKLGMQWRTLASTVGEGNASYLISDVLNLTGIDTETFVLQMNYDDFANEAAQAAAGNLFLGWLNAGTWVNAIEGNQGTNTGLTNVQGSWAVAGGSTLTLGSWGVDTSANVVWAVLDHNSQFAVMSIPEPSTYAPGLLGLVGLGLLAWRRRIRS